MLPAALAGVAGILLLAAAPLATPLAAQDTTAARAPIPTRLVRRAELLRGRVTGDSGRAIADAQVTATMAPDREVFRATTDAEGRWQIRVDSGTGDYLVHVAATAHAAFRKRVTRALDAGPGDSLLVVDAALTPTGPQQLAAVRVQARRERPPRSNSNTEQPGVGASERLTADGINGQVSPSEAGDLAALMGTIPGVVGGSVLGAGADQNLTTLNGMAFGGGEIPRDARTNVRFSSSTWDPSRGGFAGGQTNVELSPGSQFGARRARLSLDAPALQATDAVGARLGQRFLRVDASAGADGELVLNQWYYNASAQVRRSTSDAFTLLGGDPAALAAAGVSADSVTRLLDVLGAAGIPATRGGLPSERLTTSAVVLGRLDRRPRDPKQSFGVTGYARVASSEALGFSPTATPAFGGEQSSQAWSGQGIWSRYIGQAGLTEARSAFSWTRERTTPYLRLPEGRVLVSSGGELGAAGVPLAFGGNGALEGEERRWTWETTSETQYITRGTRPHRLKLYGQSRLDGFTLAQPGNQYGRVTYNSLADLDAGRPASFARTLDAPDRTGGLWSGALALGDYFRPTPRLQLVYGARLEGNAFTTVPAYNPEVARTFGARTDHAPDAVHVSPRIGFTWAPQRNADNFGYTISPIYTQFVGPRGVLRGGVGEFRALYPASLLGTATVNTGLPGGARRLLCVGDAVPDIDWSAWSASAGVLPTMCADGAGALADTAPAVTLFARDYAAARAWRANLGWSSTWRRLDYSVEALGSYNVDQPGMRDLNFTGQSRFTLAGEGGRPVFVSPAAIDPATGAVSTVEARRSAAFASVLEQHSRNLSRSRQLTITLTPDLEPVRRVLMGGMGFVRAAYVLQSTEARRGGWDAPTFGDPNGREWARGEWDARHQAQLQLGYYKRGISITTFTSLRSGLPYTPIVAGDVNGDGNAFNDRAYVFGTSSPADGADGAAVAAAMGDLLRVAPSAARECLVRQVGRAAARNGCEGPWTATMNAQVGLPGRWFGLGERNAVNLYLSNPLGGLDRLVNGERGLKGWGGPALPDPVLYRVRGFDAAAQRWQYEVNPRFGATGPSRSTLRSPFRVTVDVALRLGPTLGEQQLDRWLRPGRAGRKGTRLDSDSLLARYRRNVPDIYDRIIAESDSLLLQPSQLEALRAARAAYQRTMDAHWRTLTDYLAALGDDYDTKAALKRQEDATDEAWVVAWREAKTLDRILSPLQLKMLPWPAGMLYNGKRAPKGIRVFMSSS